MNKKNIHSDLKKIDAMKDEDMDYGDIPEFDDAFLDSAEMKFSSGKKIAWVLIPMFLSG